MQRTAVAAAPAAPPDAAACGKRGPAGAVGGSSDFCREGDLQDECILLDLTDDDEKQPEGCGWEEQQGTRQGARGECRTG